MNNFETLGTSLTNICLKLSQSQNIAKILYYNNPDPLNSPALDLNKNLLLDKYIIQVPIIDARSTEQCYLSIVTPEGEINDNDEFSTIIICVDVVVPFRLWKINNECTRPILLMHEVKKALNLSEVSNLGTLNFRSYEFDIPTDEIGTYRMYFTVDVLG